MAFKHYKYIYEIYNEKKEEGYLNLPKEVYMEAQNYITPVAESDEPQLAHTIAANLDADEAGNEKTSDAVFNLYLKAVQMGCELSLDTLENKYRRKCLSQKQILKLAHEYKHCSNIQLALDKYINLLDQSNNQINLKEIADEASKRLRELLQTYPTTCLTVLKDHYKNLDSQEQIKRLFPFYCVVAENGKLQVLQEMEQWDLPDTERMKVAAYYRDVFHDDASAQKHFKYLADRGNEQAQRELQNLVGQSGEKLYELADSYLYEYQKTKSVVTKHSALKYYLLAAKAGHAEALMFVKEDLCNLKDQLYADELILLAQIYYSRLENFIEAATILISLINKSNHEAQIELDRMIGQDGALTFEVAKLFEVETKTNFDTSETKSKRQANMHKYRILAAKLGFPAALQALDAAPLSNTQRLELAIIYRDNLKQRTKALSIFINLLDGHDRNTQDEINKMINDDPSYAYSIAQLYEQQDKIDGQGQKEKAYSYYILAAQKKYQPALEYMIRIALDGNPLAQYMLGVKYYYEQKCINEAINWCLLAVAQNYSPANHFIGTHNFCHDTLFYLAKTYEEGILIKKNIKEALYYYERIIQNRCDNPEILLNCGYFYLTDHKEDHLKIDYAKAFNCLLSAARHGSSDALGTLESIGNQIDISAHDQYQLAMFYQSSSLPNGKLRATYWLQQAADRGYKAAQTSLGLPPAQINNELKRENLADLLENKMKAQQTVRNAGFFATSKSARQQQQSTSVQANQNDKEADKNKNNNADDKWCDAMLSDHHNN